MGGEWECVSGAQTLCWCELVSGITLPEGRCAFSSTLSVSSHGVQGLEHTEIVPPKPCSLPGGRRRAEGEKLLVEGGCSHQGGEGAKPHLHISAGVDETMCTYLTVFPVR